MSAGEKKCPFCAEMIKVEAIRCRHCGSDLSRLTAGGGKKGLPIWAWIILTPIVLLVLMMVIGALSGPPSENDKARAAIDLCWKDFDDPLASIQTKRFVRGACQMMVEKFETNYGRSVTLRRE